MQTHKSGIEVVRRRCLNSIPFTICLPCMSGLSVFLSSGGSYFTWQAKVIYPKYYKKLKWTLQLFSIETNWKFWCFCFFYSFIGKTNKNSDFLHVVKVRYSRKNICILSIAQKMCCVLSWALYFEFSHPRTLKSADSKHTTISRSLFQDIFRHIFWAMRKMHRIVWKKWPLASPMKSQLT